MNTLAINRRDFFRGTPPKDPKMCRPPWVTEDALSRCTGCGDCVAACPEQILTLDDKTHPKVDFSNTGCTFCGDCAASCQHDVFAAQAEPAWQARLQISQSCLLPNGVSCQLCTDFCDYDALGFNLSKAPVGALLVAQENCTGCGMCLSACPVSAISLVTA